MDFRFSSKNAKKYPSNFYVQKKVGKFWLPTYKCKTVVHFYLYSLAFQFIFGIIFGVIISAGDNGRHFYDIVLSNTYFPTAIIYPAVFTLIMKRRTCHVIDFDTHFVIRFDSEKMTKDFSDKYQNIIETTDYDGVSISKNQLFLSTKTTFWGKTKKIYNVGIKQLRKEKLEQLFS